MKNILTTILILVFTGASFAQTRTVGCSAYTSVFTDRMTGKRNVDGHKRVLVSDDGRTGFLFSLFLGGSKEETIVLAFTAADSGSGCVDEKAGMILLLTDGTRLNIEGNSDFNCDGEFVFYFGGVFGKTEALEKLATTKIKAIRAFTMKSSIERDIAVKDSTELFNQFRCLKASMSK